MNKTNRKFISIVVATIAAGIPISTAAPHQLNFTDPLFLVTWLLLGTIASFGTYLYFNIALRDIIGTFIVGYMLAVILRFIADIVVSSITHTNLTYSLFLAMAVGAAAGWSGAGLWTLLRKTKRK